MDYPFLSKFWMFIAKKYYTFNEFIFFSEYSVLLTLSMCIVKRGFWCKECALIKLIGLLLTTVASQNGIRSLLV